MSPIFARANPQPALAVPAQDVPYNRDSSEDDDSETELEMEIDDGDPDYDPCHDY